MIFGSFSFRTLSSASQDTPIISSPEELGTVISWTRGDIATMERVGSRVYTSLTDSGVWGGTYTSGTNTHPVSVDVNVGEAPAFRGLRKVQSTTATSVCKVLHDNTGNITISLRIYLFDDIVLDRATLFATCPPSASNHGISILGNSTGTFEVAIANGTNLELAVSTIEPTSGWHTVQVTKTNTGVFSVSVDGETPVVGNITPSSSNATHAVVLGNYADGSNPANAIIAEKVIHELVLDSNALLSMRDYFNSEWNVVPEYSPLSESVDVVCWYKMDQAVSDSPPTTTVYDESGYNNHLTGTATIIDPWENTVHPGISSNNTSYSLVSGNFTQGTITQPITHYLIVNGESVAGWVDGRVSGSRNYIFNNGGSVVSLQAPTFVSSGASWINGLHLGLVRVVFNGAATITRTKQRAQVESSATSSPGTHNLTGIRMLANTFNAAWMDVNEGIGEYIVFDGVAGSDTSSIDQHSIYLREKYDLDPVLFDVSFDDPDAVITSGNFDELPNRGYFGGVVSASFSNRPITTTQNGHVAALQTSSQRVQSSLSVSTFNRLHNGFGKHTVSVVIVPGTLNSENAILANYNGTPTVRGFRLRATSAGAIQVLVANGTINTTISSADNVYQTGIPCIIHVTINNADYEIFVDGVSVATGTVSSPSTTSAAASLALGEVNSDPTGAAGIYCTANIIEKVLTTSEIITDAAVLASKWVP